MGQFEQMKDFEDGADIEEFAQEQQFAGASQLERQGMKYDEAMELLGLMRLGAKTSLSQKERQRLDELTKKHAASRGNHTKEGE